MVLQTRILPFDADSIAEAARVVLSGEPVAVPTETVYGLAADATNASAVARIYEAKGRPSFNPLIIHVANIEVAERIGEFCDFARKLAEEHWPGPLTLVVPRRENAGIASLATAGLQSVGLRVPNHPAMQALLQATGRPLAAPSANASGTISPTRAEHVARSLSGRIALIIDGGPTERGLESTIVAATDGELRLLRPGPIQLQAETAFSGRIEAPGQMASHYAPAKPLRLNATSANEGEYMIGFGAIQGESNLSPSGSLTEAAARLFDLLHEADSSSKARIAIAPVTNEGLGIAINDRLRRAAAA
ncbi:L-threonylcarbamoyladenylate synthase [Sphingomonas hankyongi]|uniref:Threonylcarbamoyl-AMP synthase n=1 Tax=Sphingomonas hankyongi TaxID=2908209 RepID=A0ABT0S0H5_9SPHN|nr:L-threonylcarbamoyladenylate synthase [Sphingomonas hankyongi]MCL6729374.1 L-threonylcarbamoyladenylate synthase [Sphingomonas hankyongi]